ncbi:MAG: hypothetical protein R2754_15540 [Microthrixaceae bacterium]
MHAAPHRTTQRHHWLAGLRVAVAAAVTLCWVFALGAPVGAQDDTGVDQTPTSVELGGTNGDATQPTDTVVDTPSAATTVPDELTDGGGSAGADDEPTSDEGLLNLIIIGLLVLAAIIAVATLLFWKSTAPVDGDEDAAEAPEDAKEPVPAPSASAPVAPAAPASAPEPKASGGESPEPADPQPAEAAPRRRVMASFPSSPLGDAAAAPAPAADPPPAPVADAASEHLSTLGAGASPGRPSVPPPDAVHPAAQPEGAYRIPAPDELPPQPDRPFADPATRPPVERAPDAAAPSQRTLPAPAETPDQSSAVVSTSKPAGEDAKPAGDADDGPPVVVRRRRRDRAAGPWGEGVGGGSRPEVPRMETPEAENQGYQRGVRVIRPEQPDDTPEGVEPSSGDA